MCIREGLMISALIDHRLERQQPVIDLPHFSQRQIQKAHIWFNYHVYKGYKPLWWILMQTVMSKVRSNITLNFLFRRIIQWPGLNYMREKLTKI